MKKSTCPPAYYFNTNFLSNNGIPLDTIETLQPFFNPKGVVVAGARSSPGFGYTIPVSLIKHGWGEKIYLYNPKGGELHGKNVYTSLKDLPDCVELAIVIVPSPGVIQVMEELGECNIKKVVLETAGFSEIGEKGNLLQEKLIEIIKKYNMRVIGPNCLGVVNTDNQFHSVGVIDEAFRPGPVSIIAQSGMFGSGLLDFAYERNLYFSKVITLGNRIDVNECEMLEYLCRDKNTNVIAMYIESVSNGRHFIETLRRTTADKPVIILKSGRTGAGKKATASHTGSLSGEDEIYEAVFNQCGAIRADNIDDFLDLSSVLGTQPLPDGKRLGILTTSGSMGVMAADAAASCGLDIPDPSPETVSRVKEGSPDWMNVKNPLDVGPSTQFSIALKALFEDPAIDMVLALIILPFVAIRAFKKQGIPIKKWLGDIYKIRSQYPSKPFVICSIGNSEFLKDVGELAGESIPVLSSPNQSVKALAALWEYSSWKRVNEEMMEESKYGNG